MSLLPGNETSNLIRCLNGLKLIAEAEGEAHKDLSVGAEAEVIYAGGHKQLEDYSPEMQAAMASLKWWWSVDYDCWGFWT